MEGNRVHFIAIGGSAMHNLALALHFKGYNVTGSDDEIFDPAKSRLAACGLLPEKQGWFPEKLTPDIDAIILGMHARNDNPELARAKRMGLKIYSYPEFLYEESKDKLRIVIGGSHGKTTITAMILHVMRHAGIDCDYMVGAKLEGFDVMVKLTGEAPFMVFEGDEYLTSALDPRPKFHLYKPDIALISGIAWDHMNVFPTFEKYVEQFRIFGQMVPDNGSLIYCKADKEVEKLVKKLQGKMLKLPYSVPSYRIENGLTILQTTEGDIPLKVFGKHNLMNLEGARLVCNLLEVSDQLFYEAISSYGGASNRLELLARNERTNIFRDFAHAPSKLMATIDAAKEQFPERWLVACFELHTYSSLNKNFLSQYAASMDNADLAIVYFSPHALQLKKLPMLNIDEIKSAFGKKRLQVFTDPSELQSFLLQTEWEDTNLLMMSSGNFDGINLKELAGKLV
jgi:UDP-N-acetylmuramate: L-alanyl-gamma-D-glutamyl-meso-diaminopimelate ligase